MNGDFVLDTNIVIALVAREPNVVEHVARANRTTIPTAVFAELYFGALRSNNPAANVRKIEALIEAHRTLPLSISTARYFAEIKLQLSAKGRPIPMNDIWIAAQAMEHGATVATRDRHFQEIDGLACEHWA